MTTLTRALFLAILLTSTLALAQGTYTQIDYPGATQTYAYGIDSSGDVVGLYEDSLGTHGFLLVDGLYTPIDYPGAQVTYLMGVNSVGEAVGGTESSGFSYSLQLGAFSAPITYPGSSYTAATAVNDDGTIVGYYAVKKQNGHEREFGFELVGSDYTQIDYPAATSTRCFGINNSGEIVGTYLTTSTAAGFLLNNGVYTNFTTRAPGGLNGINNSDQIIGTNGHIGFIYSYETQRFTTVAYPGTFGATDPVAINDLGTVVGHYLYHAVQRGFELVGSTYTEIVPPDAKDVYLNGIADSGEIVGFAESKRTGMFFNFVYSQGTYQRLTLSNVPDAFVYGISPDGTALIGIYAPSSGTAAGFVYQNQTVQTILFPGAIETNPTGINDSGEVAGYFVDSSGKYHGFLWTPPVPAHRESQP